MTDIEFHTTNSNIVYGASKGNVLLSTNLLTMVLHGVNLVQVYHQLHLL